MKRRKEAGVAGVLKLLIGLASAGFIALFLFIAASRVAYPYELEWLEGSSLQHVGRVLAGQPLYVKPNIEFIPNIYPPLYFIVCAAAAKVMGFGFIPLRLVSSASTVGCFLLIFAFVRRESGSGFFGLASAGLFAACFRISEGWFDLARVDMLYVFLLLAASYALRFHRGAADAGFGGLLLALAFHVKQTGLIMGAPLLVWMLWKDRRAAAAAIGSFVLVAGGGALFLQQQSGGWYWFYIFALPSQHPYIADGYFDFLLRDLGYNLPVALALAAYYLAGKDRRMRESRMFLGCLAAGFAAGSWISRLHDGGFINVVIPAFAAAALLFGVGLKASMDAALRLKKHRSAAVAALLLCVLIQFAALRFDSSASIPSKADLKAGDDLVAYVRGIDGEVFIPLHGYLAVAAGKGSYANAVAMYDIMRGRDEPSKEMVREALRQSIVGGRFKAVIVDEEKTLPDLARDFKNRTLFPFGNSTVFRPVEGSFTRPEIVYY